MFWLLFMCSAAKTAAGCAKTSHSSAEPLRQGKKDKKLTASGRLLHTEVELVSSMWPFPQDTDIAVKRTASNVLDAFILTLQNDVGATYRAEGVSEFGPEGAEFSNSGVLVCYLIVQHGYLSSEQSVFQLRIPQSSNFPV